MGNVLSGVGVEGDVLAAAHQRRQVEVGLAPSLVDKELVRYGGDDPVGVLGVDVFGGEVDSVARGCQVSPQGLVDVVASEVVKTQCPVAVFQLDTRVYELNSPLAYATRGEVEKRGWIAHTQVHVLSQKIPIGFTTMIQPRQLIRPAHRWSVR